MNTPGLATIRTQPNNQAPLAYYGFYWANNYDSIYDKTRFTYQPDTAKPIKPKVDFVNIKAGCFDIAVTDSSVNETLFRIERMDSGPDYYFHKHLFSTTPGGQGTVYTQSETRMQPDSLYKYRIFASTGFINSDTILKELRTPMPMISGVVKIPGDYPSITALLSDAECKHLGPELAIELQSNYSYSVEPASVRFGRNLNTKVLRNVSIRPATGVSSLVLINSRAAPFFTFDSVKFIGLDGRAGGVGTDIVMTLRQLDATRPALSYVYFADSGTVQYCNIEGRSTNSNFGLVYLGYIDWTGANLTAGVNGTIIRNCKIGPASGTTSNLLLYSDNNGRGNNITIEKNEFYRFSGAAIRDRVARNGVRITGNRFYQPELIGGTTTSIDCQNLSGSWLIDSNRIGGSVAQWGVGKWSSSGSFSSIPMISCAGTGNLSSQVTIRGNEFGNISVTSGTLRPITVSNLITNIEYNKIGTADSINSVVCSSHNYAIGVGGSGTKTINNNFISGLQADYPNRTSNQDLIMVIAFFQDSVIIRGNDFGGSNNRFANYTGGQATCISLAGIKNAIIKNNEIRGITSKNTRVMGIEQEFSGTSATEKNMIADSNRIHHLQGRLTAYGIYSNIYSAQKNTFNNNDIYALRGIGPSTQSGAVTNGIVIDHFLPPNYNSPIDTSSVEIANNYIHNFEYTYSGSPVYGYMSAAIAVSGRRIKVNNNMIQLGIAANGSSTDSVELEITAMWVQPLVRAEIEHNSIYIGGTGSTSAAFNFPLSTNNNGYKNIFVTNNIIQIDRNRGVFPNGQAYMPGGTGNSVVSNKNIWYSTNDPNITSKLNDWRTRCQCDSSTVIGNPQYINPAGDSISQNLHLQPGSIADSSGTPSVSPVPKDIDDQLRINYSPVDIGADAITPCAGNTGVQLQLSPDKDYLEACPGSTIPLSVSVTGGSVGQIQWQRNLNNIAGATSSGYTVTQPGSYRAIAKLACGSIASRTIIVVNSISAPVAKVKSLTSAPYCDSGRVTLQVEYTQYTTNTPQIKWYKNNVLQPHHTGTIETFDTIKANDRYRAEVINTLTCGTFTGKDSIVIPSTSPSTRPKIQIIRYDTLRCGTNIDTIRYRVTNANSFATVLFITPAPGATITHVGDSLIILGNLPNQNVQVRLYTPSSPSWICFYPDTSQVLSLNYAPTNAPVASLSGNNIVSSSSTNNQWYSTPDNIIAGATGQSYTPAASGSYFVRVIQGTCISEKSNIISFVYTAVPQVNPPKEELQLFPNPTSGSLWLKSEILTETLKIAVIDATGRTVQNTKLSIQRNLPATLNLDPVLHGIYFIKIDTKQKSYIFKIVVL